jgi:hypothetical protein
MRLGRSAAGLVAEGHVGHPGEIFPQGFGHLILNLVDLPGGELLNLLKIKGKFT